MKIIDLWEDAKSEYDNWVMHDLDTLKSDFDEYKYKESRKWEQRSEDMGFRFPIFNSFEEYKSAIESGTVTRVDDSLWNSVRNLSANSSLDDIRVMVNGYTNPRDVDRIVKGIEGNNPIPYPVILKGKNGLFIMSGNTRMNVAKVMGNTPKALIVDVSE